MIRTAIRADTPALVEIEQLSFRHDQISERSFVHLLTKANAITLIDEQDKQIRGYVSVFFRSNSALARIYSIATHPAFLKQGVAARLLRLAEHSALVRSCDTMQLEIRTDNQASLNLFQAYGYQKFGQYHGYYQDGTDAHRVKKSIAHPLQHGSTLSAPPKTLSSTGIL